MLPKHWAIYTGKSAAHNGKYGFRVSYLGLVIINQYQSIFLNISKCNSNRNLIEKIEKSDSSYSYPKLSHSL